MSLLRSVLPSFRVAFFIGVSLLVTGCAQLGALMQGSVESPEVVSKTIKVSKMDFNYIYFDADIELFNPNAIAVDLDGFDYTLDVDGKKLIQGDNNGLKLKSKGTAKINLPFKVALDSLIKLAPELLEKDELEYKFATLLTLNGPLGFKWEYPVTLTKTVPNPKLPDIKAPKIKLDTVSLSGMRVKIALPVSNPNVFGINLEQLRAALVVNGMKPVEIDRDKTIRLPAKGETSLDIPLSFSWDSASRSLLSLLKDGDTPEIKLEGSWKLNPELPGFDVQRTDFGFDSKKRL